MMIVKTASRKKNYTVIPNEILDNDNLSWKAKGILSYLLRLPENWTVVASEIVKHSPDGRVSLRNGFAELEKAGYLVFEQVRNEEGQFAESFWTVYDEPQTTPENTKTDCRKPDIGKPETNKYLNKQRLIKPLLQDDKKISKNSENDIPEQNPDTAEIFKAYNKIGVLTSYVADDINAFLEEGISPDWIIAAIKEAALSGVHNWKYIAAILNRWKTQGFQSDKPEAKPQAKTQGKRIAGRKHNPNIPLEKRNDKRYAGMEFIGFDDEEGAE